jgi:hypothetical protein
VKWYLPVGRLVCHSQPLEMASAGGEVGSHMKWYLSVGGLVCHSQPQEMNLLLPTFVKL